MEDKDLQKMKTKDAVKELLSKGCNCQEIGIKLKKHPEHIRRVRRQIKEESRFDWL